MVSRSEGEEGEGDGREEGDGICIYCIGSD